MRIEAREDFVAAMEQGGFDIILADYALPQFDGLSALAIAKEKCPDIPFIIVSGAIGEELAIEILGSGATDYLLKDHLSRLIPAVHRALKEAGERIEHKRAEEALKQEKQFSEDAINSLPGFFYVYNNQGKLVRWNKKTEQVTGYTADEMLYMPGTDFFKGDDKSLIASQMQEVFEKGESEAEAHLVTKHGDRIPYYFTGSKTIIGEETYLVGLGIDITERKQAMEALKTSEVKFRAISSTAADAILLMDNDGKITYWNPSAEKLFGYTSNEAIGKDLHILLVPTRYYKDFKRGFGRFKKTGQGTAIGKMLELNAIRKDGTEFPIELSISATQIEGQ